MASSHSATSPPNATASTARRMYFERLLAGERWAVSAAAAVAAAAAEAVAAVALGHRLPVPIGHVAIAALGGEQRANDGE